jgi:hypothetical protein
MERSNDMQVDDRQTSTNRQERRWRGPLIGIAAGAVVLIGGWIFVDTGDDDVVSPAPNATLLTDEMRGEPIEPGAYYADTDGDPATSTRGTFVIEGDGWEAANTGARYTAIDEIVLMVVEVDTAGAPSCGGVPGMEIAATSAEGLANQFAAAGFTIREAVTSVSAFGRNGYHLVVEVPPGCDSSANVAWRGPTFGGRYYHQSPGQMVEYWILDVEGTPVLVEASWRAENTEEDLAPLRAALDTLVITP